MYIYFSLNSNMSIESIKVQSSKRSLETPDTIVCVDGSVMRISALANFTVHKNTCKWCVCFGRRFMEPDRVH